MMRAQGAPRKVYSRNGITHICFQGLYFKPPQASKVDPDREVSKVEPLKAAGGKARIAVSQRVGGKTITETWAETEVPVQGRRQGNAKKAPSKKRTKKAKAHAEAAPSVPSQLS